MASNSAHLDSFAADNLPARDLWPRMDYGVLPELHYPERLNCAVELLDGAIRAGFSEKTAIFFRDQAWSYAELLERSNKLAHVLSELPGFVPGKRVLLRGPNTPFMAAAWFAVLKAGGICVTTMPLLREKELSYMIEKARVEYALCDSAWRSELDQAASASEHLRRVLYFENGPDGQLEKMMAGKPAAFDSVSTSAEDVALLAFTSGSTGRAKATMHFHRDVMAICDLFPPHVLKAERSDVFCGSPPLAFTFGLGGLLLFPMRVGASTVFVDKPQPDELLRAVQERRVSVLFTSPTAYKAMLPQVAAFNLSSLRKCVAAGETLPLSTFNAWEQATGIRIIDGIGATEMLHIFISASGDEIRPGATGKVVPGYEARVVNESGQPVPDGQVGLLAVRGPTGCRYLADAERQKGYVRGGWNFTGDAYVRDADGYFWFHSRADDMIISSGYNISGVEVENVLLSHPAVKECGVVGVPDEERGAIVKAFVVLRDGGAGNREMARELQDFVKAQIAPYKYPRAVEFVPELPRTETGKLQRFRLRG